MARKTFTAQKCPKCNRSGWKGIDGTRFEMSERGNFAVSVGRCKHCGLSFIDVRKMTQAEIAAELKRLAAERAEAERAEAERAEAERAEAERREREVARIMLERKLARQKAKRS